MKKKTVPSWIQNLFLVKIIRSRIGTVLSYWIFQGMLYMDTRERMFKIAMDISFAYIFYSFNVNIFLSIFLAHTMNMLFNGHYYAMKSHMNMGNIDAARFIQYVEGMFSRLQKAKYLLGAAAYGSLSRNIFRSTSDIDLRIFPEEGIMSWIKAVCFVFIERQRAFMHAFPLDIYAFELGQIDSKMRSDEPPIIFFDPEKRLIEKYQAHVLFDKFAIAFREKYVANEK